MGMKNLTAIALLSDPCKVDGLGLCRSDIPEFENTKHLHQAN